MSKPHDPRFERFDTRVGEKARRVEVARSGEDYVARLGSAEEPVRWVPLGGGRVQLSVGGRTREFRVQRLGAGRYAIDWGGRQATVEVQDELLARAGRGQGGGRRAGSGPVKLAAPMPGTVVEVHVAEGARVEKGQPLLVIEAMKMQNEVLAPAAGIVQKLAARAGQPVEARFLLCVIAPA